MAIAQSGGIELHPWGCKPGDPETPEQLTFDLDPDEGLDFEDVIAAAKDVKATLEVLGLNPFVKTTGGKGLHVVVADQGGRAQPGGVGSGQGLRQGGLRAGQGRGAGPLHHHPVQEGAGREDLSGLPAQRAHGDGGGALVSAGAARGAAIAFPLSWGQVRKGLDPKAFTLRTAPALLKKPDPWKDFRKGEAALRPILKKVGVG